ncbi:MAG: diguanylate cyclase [Candidatus Brocadiales bacterium]|nr:diguanylate cyclase [Candidatus Brocadiales bacterium]
MKEKISGFSIKAKLILFSLCISLIPIATVTAIYYLNAANELKRNKFDELRAVGKSKKLHVLSFIQAKRDRAADFSSDGFVREFVKKINEYKSLPDAVNALNRHLMENKKPLDPHITSIEIANKNGIVIASTHEALMGNDVSNYEGFKQSINKSYGSTFVDRPGYCDTANANVLPMYSPIISIADKETMGVIIICFDMSAFRKITTDRTGLGESGEVYLVNSDKVMITESRFIDDAAFKLTVDTLPVHKILEENKETADIYKDYRGIPVVGVSANIPEYNWIVLAEIDKAEAFASLWTLGIAAIVVGGISGALVIILGIVFSVSMARPISDLKYATERFSQGDLDYMVNIKRRDELGKLANSFNDMARKLAHEITTHKQTKEKLHEFAYTVENGPSVITITDIKGNIEYVNPRFTQLTGYAAEEVIGKNPHFLKSGRMSPNEYKQLWETIISGSVWRGELYNKKKNGTLYWESASISSVKNTNNEIIHFIKIAEDITECKQIKKRLDTQYAVTCVLTESNRISESTGKMLRSICECLGWDLGGIWLYDVQANVLKCGGIWHTPYRDFPEFKAISMQIAFPPGVGLPGRTWTSAKPAWIGDVVADPNFPRAAIARKEGLHGAFGFPIISGSKVLGVIEFFSHEIQQPDEDLLDMMGAIGKQIGLFLTRKQTEEQLRKLSQAVEQSSSVVMITDTKGNIEYVNPRFIKLTGYFANEIIGKNPRILKSGKTPPEVYKRLWETITSGSDWQGEFCNKKKNGEIYWEYASISPIRNSEGIITNYLAVKEDFTEHMQTEETLKKLNETLGQRVKERTEKLEERNVELHREIIERKQTEEERNKNIADLKHLIEFSDFMSIELQEDMIMKRVLHVLKEYFNPDIIAVLKLNNENRMIDVPFVDPPVAVDKLIKNEVILDPSLCRVIRTGQKVIVMDVGKEPGCECILYDTKEYGHACLPLNVGGNVTGVVVMIKKDTGRWNDDTYRLLTAYVGIVSSAIYRVRLIEVNKQASITDALTGIHNRRFFDEMVRKQIALAKRDNEPLSLLIADLDHFKKVNDTYGHITGDIVLQQIATIMKTSIRSSDILARYGGEEFVITMPSTGLTGALEKADKIRHHIESLDFNNVAGGQSLKMTLSMGVASLPEHGIEFVTLLNAADSALYKAKKGGRNRVEAP